MNRISFYTFGCRLNQSETATIEKTFEAKGYKVVDFKDPADIVVVNTCTVTENGDADTRRLVNKISRSNPQARIALVGCQAQMQKENLLTMPSVHWVVGNERKMELAAIIDEHKTSDQPVVITPTISRKSFTVPIAALSSHHTRANLKIQDGCDFFCSFCEIPFARGRARSRVFDDILKEANELAKAGRKEIVLTGINIGTYDFENKTILDVLDALERIEDLKRIRISSIEPTTIPFEVIKRMGKTKLCRHLHIPLQSASNKILKLMKRKYTAEEFSQFILKAHKTVSEICIGTDIIVGFPGETDELFEETLSFVRDLPISYFHVFSYSERTMNKSNQFTDKVPAKTIQKRSEALRALSSRKRQLFLKSLSGTTQNVLFEAKKNGSWPGWTDNYVRLKIKSDENLRNKLIPVKIGSAQELAGQTAW